MKKTSLLIPFLFCIMFAFADKDAETITQAKKLIEERKYETAYMFLNSKDPKNERPDITLLKVNLAMNYYASNINYQTFFFKDLLPSENLSDIRTKPGSYSVYNFPVNEILEALVLKYPKEYKLNIALADYYYEVYIRYVDDWLIKSDELYKRMLMNYNLANNNEAGTFDTYYKVGCIYLNQLDYAEAIPPYMNALRFKSDDASTNYNLAYVYMSLDRSDSALKYSKIAYQNYQDPKLKADAARMIGLLSDNTNNMQSAIEYYTISSNLDSSNRATLLSLIEVYIKTNNAQEREKTILRYFKVMKEESEKYTDFSELMNRYSKNNELIEIYFKLLKIHEGNHDLSGNYYFYLAQAYKKESKISKAKEMLNKAKEEFSILYSQEDPIFKTIKELEDLLK